MDTTPTKTKPPFVSDEQIKKIAASIYEMPLGLDPTDEEDDDIRGEIEHSRFLVGRGMKEARLLYEPLLSRLRTEHLTQLAERDKVIEGLRKQIRSMPTCSCMPLQ